MGGKLKVLSSRAIYNGWFKVREDALDVPKLSEPYPYGVITVEYGVAVIPFLDKDTLLLEVQYRHPLGQEFLELIQGGLKPGESPRQGAMRELREETGYEPQHLEFLMSVCLMPGSLDHKLDIYVATDLRQVSEQDLEPAELLEVVVRPYESVLEEVLSGMHLDGALNAGLQRYELLRLRKLNQ